MRCIFGLVLFVALCYGGIQLLYAVSTGLEVANAPGMSRSAAQAAGWKVAQKYHVLVYVAAGVITLGACSLPSFLGRQTGFDEQQEWRRMNS